MNYLFLDTEGTYNIGYVVMSDKGDILSKEQLVIKENFSNNKLCGEENHKRKEKIFATQNTFYGTGAEVIRKIHKVISQYSIKYMVAYNSSTDIHNVTAIYEMAKPYLGGNGNPLDKLQVIDAMAIVRFLYEKENTDNISLDWMVNDILGTNLRQKHTGLDDALWLAYFMQGIADIVFLWGQYNDIMCHLDQPMKDAINVLGVQLILNKDLFARIQKPNYTIKTMNTRMDILTQSLLVYKKENIQLYSEKTKKPLKTLGVAYQIIPERNTDMVLIKTCINKKNIFTNKIKDCMVKSFQTELDESEKTSLKIFEDTIRKNFIQEKTQFDLDKIAFKNQMKEIQENMNRNFALKEQTLEKEVIEKKNNLDAQFVAALQAIFKKENKDLLKLIKKGKDIPENIAKNLLERL